MSKYAIWNKTDKIYTPVGEVLSSEAWISRYGWMENPRAKPVVASGLINGAFCGELGEMVSLYTAQGCDFSSCQSDEDYLEAISAFEVAPTTTGEPSTEERTAAALEFIAMSSLPDGIE